MSNEHNEQAESEEQDSLDLKVVNHNKIQNRTVTLAYIFVSGISWNIVGHIQEWEQDQIITIQIWHCSNIGT